MVEILKQMFLDLFNFQTYVYSEHFFTQERFF